tara:strand:+ start:3136 stop:3792 length:657 start_codon:yes stop_codon:yes gene_type:complete
MERNIITEIKNIKRLINILEATDTDCEKQLEDKGWVVDSPEERRLKGVDCGDPGTKLSCLLDYLDKEGVTKRLTTEHGQNCYTELWSNKTYKWGNQSFWSKYITFFESGHLNYVVVFDPDHAPKLKPGTSDEWVAWQYMFRGNWKCDKTDPSDIKIKFFNMRYCCSFEKGDTTKEKTVTYKWKRKASDPSSSEKPINQLDGWNDNTEYDLDTILSVFK